jgi:hypothetical protein
VTNKRIPELGSERVLGVYSDLIEAGRPITVTTLLRICEVFEISADRLIRGLDKGIYSKAK